MEKKGIFTKFLAMVGTVLVWLPILTPCFFAVIVSVRAHVSLSGHFDYLMPAELFPVALVGGGLLLGAALRARSRRGLIGGSLASAVVLLVGSQALAVVTGLASGETAATGWQWTLVIALLGLYILALVVMGVGGVLLLRDLSKTAFVLSNVLLPCLLIVALLGVPLAPHPGAQSQVATPNTTMPSRPPV